MKPHLYHRAGRWFCRLDVGTVCRLGPGRSTPSDAYEAFSQVIEFWLDDLLARHPVRDATVLA